MKIDDDTQSISPKRWCRETKEERGGGSLTSFESCIDAATQGLELSGWLGL